MKNFFTVFLTSFLLWALSFWFGAKNLNYNLWKTDVYGSTDLRNDLDLKEFWSVYDAINKEYFTDEGISKQDIVEGAIAWMVDSLGDKHSEFLDPELTKRFEQALTWDFEGIGAVVEKVTWWVLVERIIKWSPAKKYDVRSGDIIIEANGVELVDLDLYDAVEEIKGPADTQVLLKIVRPWEEKLLEIQVKREKIHIPSVEEEYFEAENIAYISINLYGETTAEEFSQALENVSDSWVEGLIIDVRDNGGGYLQSAVEILSEFIEKDELLVETRYQESFFNQSYKSFNRGGIFNKKIVVLINGNSASASEITAWALREYDRALLVGEKTYGKWSVQKPFDLSGGGLLKLTVAKWFTPQGRNIDDEGIEPDIEISFQEEDYETKYDRQLEEAKKILKLYGEKNTIGLTVEAYEDTREVLAEEVEWKTQSVNEKDEEEFEIQE